MKHQSGYATVWHEPQDTSPELRYEFRVRWEYNDGLTIDAKRSELVDIWMDTAVGPQALLFAGKNTNARDLFAVLYDANGNFRERCEAVCLEEVDTEGMLSDAVEDEREFRYEQRKGIL